MNDRIKLIGKYEFAFFKDGELYAERLIENTVVTVGKNILLNTLFGGSAYTVTGPYMGLITATSFSAIAASNTMASHPGWLEAGIAHAPAISDGRQVISGVANAGAIQLLVGNNFTFTSSGTIQGAFVLLGTGAVATIDNTGGTLFSAGQFLQPIAVDNGSYATASYTLSLSP